MATMFSEMAALAASAAGSTVTVTTCGTASKSSSCASSGVSTSASLSSSLTSCESGVLLNSSSNCSSLTNSPTASSSAATVSASSSKAAPTTASPINSGMLSSSFLAAAASTCPTASSSSLPVSVVCSTMHSSTTAATTTSAHQLLLNGLGLTDVDFNAVNSTSLAEDPRALQLALELSMVGLSDTIQMQVHQQQHHLQQLQHQHLQHIQEQQQHISHQQQHHHQQQLSQQQQQQSSGGSFEMSTLSAAVAAAAAANNPASSTTSAQINQFTAALLPGIDDRSKKSQNMTECVPVPSSEHVAEIVGRQGCKIKALRAKTNTYIKTPVRGEEPVFVVTGRKEDVAKAKREILSAAEHFSVIRASRKPSLVGSLNGSLSGASGGCGKTPPGPPANSGHITIQVRVPYRVVGLVVGSKGATIKHIQQETQTYIVTPSRDRDPIFGVTGLPDNVQAARKQIEAHIAMRTGAAAGEAGTDVNVSNAATVHTINSLSQILNDDISPEFLASIYTNGLCSTFDYAENAGANSVILSSLPVVAHKSGVNLNINEVDNAVNQSVMHNTLSNVSICQLPNGGGDFLNGTIAASAVDSLNAHVFNSGLNLNTSNSVNGNSGVLRGSATNCVMNMNGGSGMPAVGSITNNANGISRSCSSASSTTSSKSTNNSGGSHSSRPELSNIWKNLGDSLDVDEGIGESPSIWGLPCVFNNAPNAHYSSSTNSISPTDSLLRESNAFGQLLAIQTQEQQERDAGAVSSNTNLNAQKQQQNQHQQLTLQQNQLLGMRRECLICADKEVTAALVPCGHNMFCMECANGICASANSVCPVCSQSVFHAMRILP